MKIHFILFFTLAIGSNICMPMLTSNQQEQPIIETRKQKTKKKIKAEIRKQRKHKEIKAQKRKIKKMLMAIIPLFLMVYGSYKKRSQQNITQSQQNSDPNITQSDPNPVQDGTSTSENGNARGLISLQAKPELNPNHINESRWLSDQNQTFPDKIIEEVEKLVAEKNLKEWKRWVVLTRDLDLCNKLIEFLNKQGIQLSSNRKEKNYIYMVAYEKLIKHSTKYSPLAMAYILTQLFMVLASKKNLRDAQSLIKGNSVDNLLGKAIYYHQSSHTEDKQLLQKQEKGKANLIPSMHVIINHGQFKEASSEDVETEKKYSFKMEEVKLKKNDFGYDSVHKLAKARRVNIDDIAHDEVGDLRLKG